MARPLLCFVAIVKDEAKNFRKTLESVKPFVDCYTILDTGSTDGTQALIREVMEGVPGAIYEESFVDFATTRNRVLELSKVSQNPIFTLMMSGDEVFQAGSSFRDYLDQHKDAADGAYCIELRGGETKWLYFRVLRTDGNWRYVGAIHEVPVGPKGEDKGTVVPSASITYTMSDPIRHSKRVKEFDLPTLTKMVEDDSKSLEERAQAIWFLAQTHEYLADEHPREPGSSWLSHKLAAMALYWRRHELGGDVEKMNYALYRFFNAAETAGFFGHAEMVERMKHVVAAAPTLPEARYSLARHMMEINPKQALALAEDAARVSRESRLKPSHMPSDARVEWLAYRLAVECSMMLKEPKRAKAMAEKGIAAGGPKATFAEFLGV